MLSIDESKCNKDSLCALECPARLIRMGDGDGFPEAIEGAQEICIGCGHCVAVCPEGALSHQSVPIEDCPPIQKELFINEQQAAQFLRHRRSIRVYRDKPVEKEKIQRLIELARYGPTGSNTQMVEWLVFNDSGKVKHLSGLTAEWIREVLQGDPAKAPYPVDRLRIFLEGWDNGVDTILRGAPAVVVAIAPEDVGNQMVDPTIALTYFELAAPTLGLGTCWAGLLVRGLRNSRLLREAVGLTDRYPFYYPMMVGYPKFNYHRLPERRPPRIIWK
ncbi:MAG: 4Fe-4S dicluster domain-containing protein [Desulfobulbaceae bacterium]|nr:4Fe-4S dicluster domain-containing protein [Desulfobulbaceae bacterium]